MLSVRTHYGFIIAHRPTVVYLQQKHVFGIEAEMLHPFNGNADWQQAFDIPLYGIAYQYFNLGNETVLGNAHAITPRIVFPLSKNHWLRTSITAGFGIGYIEKTFNRYENFKNVAIGSHINSVVFFNMMARARINKRLNANAGLAFTHFSNGSIKPPNLGFNIPSITLGATAIIGRMENIKLRSISPAKKILFHKISAGTGIKGLEKDGGVTIYNVQALHYSVQKVFSYKSTFGIGADAFHDRSLVKRYEQLTYEKASKSVSFRCGLSASYTLTAGKLGLIFQNGIYIIDSYKKDGKMYSVLGIEYLLNNHLFALLNIKAHKGKADYFEIGIGYSLSHK